MSRDTELAAVVSGHWMQFSFHVRFFFRNWVVINQENNLLAQKLLVDLNQLVINFYCAIFRSLKVTEIMLNTDDDAAIILAFMFYYNHFLVSIDSHDLFEYVYCGSHGSDFREYRKKKLFSSQFFFMSSWKTSWSLKSISTPLFRFNLAVFFSIGRKCAIFFQGNLWIDWGWKWFLLNLLSMTLSEKSF